MKEKQITFEELIDLCFKLAFDGLIKEGTKGLRSAMFSIFQHIITYYKQKESQDVSERERKTI